MKDARRHYETSIALLEAANDQADADLDAGGPFITFLELVRDHPVQAALAAAEGNPLAAQYLQLAASSLLTQRALRLARRELDETP